MREWTPRDYAVLTVTGTVCLCLVVLVLGTVIGVMNGSISAAVIGRVGSAGLGSGLLGFGLILYWILKVTLAGVPSDGQR